MTAKEKAQQLFDTFKDVNNGDFYLLDEAAKDCAIIAIEEILKDNKDYSMHCSSDRLEVESNINYWQKVKAEIEAL